MNIVVKLFGSALPFTDLYRRELERKTVLIPRLYINVVCCVGRVKIQIAIYSYILIQYTNLLVGVLPIRRV